MPRKSIIEPFRVGDDFRIIVPKDIHGGQNRVTKWYMAKTYGGLEAAEVAAKKECRNLMEMRGGAGARLMKHKQEDLALLIRAVDEAGGIPNVFDAVRFAKAMKPNEVVTLKELVARCVLAKERRTKGGESSYTRTLKATLTRLISGEEPTLAHEIRARHIEAWINSDPHWSQDTKRTYLRDLTTLFSFGVANGFTTQNPCLNVDRPEHDDKPAFIWTPEDAERFMRSAERNDPALVQFLALCLFGGLRCDFRSEAWRIQKEDIRENEIAVQGKKVRSRNRRFVAINPTLRAWLERYPGDFSPTNLRRRLMVVRKGTAIDGLPEIEWNRNPMRHSFCSYHAEIHGFAETAKQAGHNEEILVQQYKERVTRADAEKFWGILPL